MLHYHVHVREPNGDTRLGALCLDREIARRETAIEEDGARGRRAAYEECTADCFGSRR